MLDTAVIDSGGSLGRIHEGHVGGTVRDSFATSSASHVRTISLVLVGAGVAGLPGGALLVVKGILLVSAEQVPMMIPAVSIT